MLDPRPDLREDHNRWEVLLGIGQRDNIPNEVMGALKYLRCMRTRIYRNSTDKLALVWERDGDDGCSTREDWQELGRKALGAEGTKLLISMLKEINAL
jgi:hypothetical protein